MKDFSFSSHEYRFKIDLSIILMSPFNFLTMFIYIAEILPIIEKKILQIKVTRSAGFSTSDIRFASLKMA